MNVKMRVEDQASNFVAQKSYRVRDALSADSRTNPYLVLVAILLFAFVLIPQLSYAEDVSERVYVPNSLEPWVNWVRQSKPEKSCALVKGERVCSWPSRLELKLYPSFGLFDYYVLAGATEKVSLPGDDQTRPQEVKLINSGTEVPTPVVVGDKVPLVRLTKGLNRLSGKFYWREMPLWIQVPQDIGEISVSVDDRPVAGMPIVGSDGRLWLRQASPEGRKEESDSISLQVHRLFEDGLPFRVITHVELNVSGRARDWKIASPIPLGATLYDVKTDLDHRVQADGSITFQLKPGTHHAWLFAAWTEPPLEVSRPTDPNTDWPELEYWVWQAAEQHRSVTIRGVPAIDPSRADLPSEWAGKPTYIVERQARMGIEQLRRGISAELPNELRLVRQAWLGFDGTELTCKDHMTGLMNRDWRLNAGPGYQLGSVSANGEDLLITSSDTGNGGVEIRSSNLDIAAVSKIKLASGRLPVVGWDHDVDSLTSELNIPPGWMAIAAEGVDRASGTWVSGWNLLYVFVLLIASLAVCKLFGITWGILALLTLVLTHAEPQAPYALWMHLIVAWALVQGFGSTLVGLCAKWYLAVCKLLLLLVLIPFSIADLRSAFFPQLSSLMDVPSLSMDFTFGFLSVFGIVATIILALVFGVKFLILLANGKFRKAFEALLVAFVVPFVAIPLWLGMSGDLFFGSDYSDFSAEDSIGTPQTTQYSEPAMQKEESDKDKTFSEADYEDALVRGAVGNMINAITPAPPKNKFKNLSAVDVNSVVQTGPGLPNWNWKSINLFWDGPVAKDASYRLWLISPGVKAVLVLLRLAIVLLLAGKFLRLKPEDPCLALPSDWNLSKWFGLKESGTTTAALILLSPALLSICLLASTSTSMAEDFPPKELLSDLETRLDRGVCKFDCAATERVEVKLDGDAIEMRALVHSDGISGWPIPGPVTELWPQKLLVDNEPATLRRDPQGFLWIRLTNGQHNIEVSSSLKGKTVVTLQPIIRPGFTSIEKPKGWRVDGISPTGSVKDAIQLTRLVSGPEVAKDPKAGEIGDELPNWYLVRREFELGLSWIISTSVTRLGDVNKPSVLELPVIKGESITSDNVKVEAGIIKAPFARGEASTSWQSQLEIKDKIPLSALNREHLNEEWGLTCSPVWQCRFTGANPIATVRNGMSSMQWSPWPKEDVLIEVSRPEGVAGESQTIQDLNLSYELGASSLKAKMRAMIKASRGGFEVIEIPQDATLRSVSIGGNQSAVRLENGRLSIPIFPGESSVDVEWTQASERTLRETLPRVKFERPVYNQTIQVQVPSDRWLLWVSSSTMGPVVLFWGKLAFVLLAALLLSRLGVGPLGAIQWLLLGLGLATLSPPLMLVPPAWFWLLGYRKTQEESSRAKFNFLQISIAGLTVLFAITVYTAVYQGLIFEPNMYVLGNGSSENSLRYYLDRSEGDLMQPLIISAPLWVWRTVLFLWSAWLSTAMLSWIKWGWRSASNGGVWKN